MSQPIDFDKIKIIFKTIYTQLKSNRYFENNFKTFNNFFTTISY